MSGRRPFFGMRFRLWVAAALPALLAVALLVVGFMERYNREFSAALQDRARASAEQLAGAAAFPLFAGDQAALQRIADSAVAADSQLLAVAFFDAENRLMVHAGQVSAPWQALLTAPQSFRPNDMVMLAPVQRFEALERDVFDMGFESLSPVRSVRSGGQVALLVSLKSLDHQRRDLLWWALTISALGLGLAGLLSSLIASSVTRPIDHISEVVAGIGEGRLDTRASEVQSGVLATLATGINAMAGQVATNQAHMQHMIDRATEALKRQKESAERMARTDALTGLANRRSFAEQADNEVSRALRYQHTLSLVMVDIDHFKDVNDTHGHQAGDAVLVQVVQVLQSQVRDVDLVGRWGGEEFVVLLPNSSAQQAVQMANRMRQAVENTDIVLDGLSLHCTVSMGVAELDPHTPTLAALVSRADAAMYQAKRNGRNRVEVASDQ